MDIVLLGGETIGPAFGQNSIDTACFDGSDDRSGHGFWIRHHNAPEADVNHFLSQGMRGVDEGHEVWGC